MRRAARGPRRVSLRARLTFVYTGVFLLAGLVLLAATYALFTQQLNRALPRTYSTGISDEMPLPPGAVEGPGPVGEPDGESGSEDGAGAGSGPGTESHSLEREQRLYIIAPDGTRLTGPDARDWLIGQQDRINDAAVTSLLVQGSVALLIVCTAATGLGWLVAGRMLAPLRTVTDTARRIAAAPAADRGLHERIALRGPVDEVKDLADNFDTMVERLDRSFDGQRRFVANASHELRTPLTLGRALVEMAMHRKSASPDVKRLGEDLLEINSRHERLISGLLLLASSENEVGERHPVDLADVVGHVIAQTAPEARRAGIAVEDSGVGEAPTLGNALLLERLVHNLVENGIRHNVEPDAAGGGAAGAGGADAAGGSGRGGGTGGSARGWVRVATRVGADGLVELEVANTGPLVPPYEIPVLFEPFRRLGTDRLVTAKGAGLGLSIVRSVARAHGGEVAARPREGGGLTVTVTLPLSREDAPPEAAGER
ncbi:HAMP domain-containing histidine kinase [Streptomonospora sp. S1-112]|uniref:histidine kinase n=1 Tax=Streptomonospora mangrovi TaxID=2883123 RepID=A0A9X3NJA2_9ACTN|nr:HAMP domain-containing sensor histidine kinase [Streptomonospora mangrovi]MDA0564787.1 HAMP domain-containing histidine kinase [Streptomonospora mangrovi]